MPGEDKIIKAVIGGVIAVVAAIAGAIAGWCGRGKKENKRHAEHQRVILALEKRLREVECELADVKDLSKAKITQLREERDNLSEKIAKEKKAA